jgi:pSer/pThr/pTyr-binding forkhead associated (FHA) protein
MSSTPNHTPMVPAPHRATSTAEPVRKSPLKAPIVVIAAGEEWEHEAGDLTIGRDPGANVTLADPLVSRIHARLHVQLSGQVIIEDLHSSNGVFVNGSKVSRPLVELCEGDRLLLGTTEVSVFSLRASAKMPVSRRLDVLPEGTHRAVQSAPQTHTTKVSPALARVRPRVETDRGDAIDLIGGLADELRASGHPVEAVRVLSEHLQSLLKGASVGLTVPDRVLERATQRALQLNSWTQRSAWVDYAFELHVACRKLPSESSMQALEAACQLAPGVDRSLIGYLLKALDGELDDATAEEKQRVQRLRQLAR